MRIQRPNIIQHEVPLRKRFFKKFRQNTGFILPVLHGFFPDFCEKALAFRPELWYYQVYFSSILPMRRIPAGCRP
jgi:hypothetical protein